MALWQRQEILMITPQTPSSDMVANVFRGGGFLAVLFPFVCACARVRVCVRGRERERERCKCASKAHSLFEDFDQ